MWCAVHKRTNLYLHVPVVHVVVILVDNPDVNSTAFFLEKSFMYMYKPTIAPPLLTTIVLKLAITTGLQRTLRIEILV